MAAGFTGQINQVSDAIGSLGVAPSAALANLHTRPADFTTGSNYRGLRSPTTNTENGGPLAQPLIP
jgi:hypothetical protein